MSIKQTLTDGKVPVKIKTVVTTSYDKKSTKKVPCTHCKKFVCNIKICVCTVICCIKCLHTHERGCKQGWMEYRYRGVVLWRQSNEEKN